MDGTIATADDVALYLGFAIPWGLLGSPLVHSFVKTLMCVISKKY